MANAQSQALGITDLSQLAPKVSQLILVTPPDGRSFVDDLKVTYGFDRTSFNRVLIVVGYSIANTLVAQNQAQVSVCYTTDGSIAQQNLVALQDDKNGFPAFNPAPIVRDSVLSQDPEIKTILNPLVPKLTTAVSALVFASAVVQCLQVLGRLVPRSKNPVNCLLGGMECLV